eukprot:6229851-Prymnesium_polylepis.1
MPAARGRSHGLDVRLIESLSLGLVAVARGRARARVRVQRPCEARSVGSAHKMCKCWMKRGVRAAGRGRGRIMASGSAGGAAAVRGRSSVEARAGPDLRISDQGWA